MLDVAAVIVNWNGKKFLTDCFNSLVSQSVKNFKIIFVDNGSNDGSVSFVNKNYLETGSLNIEIIELKKNTGFCYGNNIGVAKALEDKSISYILVLNNDTKLQNDFMENIIECAEKFPEAGAVQPKVLNFYRPEKIDCAGITVAKDGTAHNRGYQENKDGYDEELEIFGANATAGLFTRKALEKTMLAPGEYFDNYYFAYYEDVDLAWRIRLAGFRAYFCPKATVYHMHSATAGKSSLLKAFYLHRNYFFTVFKNYPFGIMIKTLCWRFLSYVSMLTESFSHEKRMRRFADGQSKGKVMQTIFKAWGSVVYNLPGISARRRAIKKISKASKGEIKLWLEQYQAE